VVQAKRKTLALGSAAWFALLGLTRPLRHKLGLRQDVVPKVQPEKK
jgi:hypothetical protein